VVFSKNSNEDTILHTSCQFLKFKIQILNLQ
jgi:hypothetical protein